MLYICCVACFLKEGSISCKIYFLLPMFSPFLHSPLSHNIQDKIVRKYVNVATSAHFVSEFKFCPAPGYTYN